MLHLKNLSTNTLIAARELHVIASGSKTRAAADENYNVIGAINEILYERRTGRPCVPITGYPADAKQADEVIAFEDQMGWKYN